MAGSGKSKKGSGGKLTDRIVRPGALNKRVVVVPRVVVRVAPGLFPNPIEFYRPGAERLLTGENRKLWDAMAADFRQPVLMPLFGALPPGEIKRLVREAQRRDPEYKDPGFFEYFQIAVPAGKGAARKLADVLRQLPFVRDARASMPVPPPGLLVQKDPETSDYVEDAPLGHGVMNGAWNVADGGGASVSAETTVGEGPGRPPLRFGMVDNAWLQVTHPDLPAVDHCAGAPAMAAVIDPAFVQHGTACLGIVAALQNGSGMVGMAPKLACLPVIGSSYAGSGSIATWKPEDALLAVSARLVEGDVLLVEQQALSDFLDYYVPLEAMAPAFEVIYNAATRGVVVIEPAGNYKNKHRTERDGEAPDRAPWMNLDDPANRVSGVVQEVGERSLVPGGPDYLDSRAIMVSAAYGGAVAHGQGWGHERLSWVNSGSRVDCYSWGESVRSAGATTLGDAPSTNCFSGLTGTSAASAIVAGLALLVQDRAIKLHGRRLKPLFIRERIFRAGGTPVVDVAGGAETGRFLPNLAQLDSLIPSPLDVPDAFF